MLILAKEFILDFFGLGMVANVIICGYIVLRLTLSEWRFPYYLYMFVGVMALAFGFSLALDGGAAVALKNLLRIAQVFLYAAFCAFLRANYAEDLTRVFRQSAFLFNAILVLNIFVIMVQFWFPGEFVARSEGVTLSLEDTMSGLFGPASTHGIAVYTTFVVIYDLELFYREKYDVRAWIYLLALVVSSLYVATLNDNKALFFFLPLGFLLCLVMYCVARPQALIKTILPCAFGVIVFMVVLYALSPGFRGYFDQHVLKSIDIAIRAFDLNAYVNGSDERFKLISYAVCLPSSWFIGDGFGAADLYQEGYRGFNHFGLSDFGSIAILGGIWFYLLVLYFFIRPFGKFSKANAPLNLSIMMLFALMAFYTQVFTQVRIAIPALLLACALCCFWDSFRPPNSLRRREGTGIFRKGSPVYCLRERR